MGLLHTIRNMYTIRTFAAGLGVGARIRESPGGQHDVDTAFNSYMKSGLETVCTIRTGNPYLHSITVVNSFKNECKHYAL